MEPFASVAQYKARFAATADDAVIAECLADASAAIRAALDAAGVDYSEPSDEYADRLMRVCRSAANRIMPAQTGTPEGATQLSMTAGPYTESYTLIPAYASAKLLQSELELLGIGRRARGRSLRPSLGGGGRDD